MNFTPCEMKILLEVHTGMPPTSSRGVALFHETIDDFVRRGLVLRAGGDFLPGPALPALMHHVLNAPRPLPLGQRPDLTKQQMVVFAFLLKYIKTYGMAPTRREIADRFGFSSQTAAQDHLEALQRKGYVELGAGRMRAIRAIP